MKTYASKKGKIYFPGTETVRSGKLELSSANSGLRLLSFQYLFLTRGEVVNYLYKAQEAVIILLKGTCVVDVTYKKYTLGLRRDVFSHKSHSLYVSPNTPFKVRMMSTSGEVIIVTAPMKSTQVSAVEIPPQRVRVKEVGRASYRRAVHTIYMGKAVGTGSHLLVGETFNRPGRWSSFPPHKHAHNKGRQETRYEEIYFFKIRPRNGFGIIRVYDDVEDTALSIHHNDCVIVTEGYHPVCAAPGCDLYYLWVMVGSTPAVVANVDKAFKSYA